MTVKFVRVVHTWLIFFLKTLSAAKNLKITDDYPLRLYVSNLLCTVLIICLLIGHTSVAYYVLYSLCVFSLAKSLQVNQRRELTNLWVARAIHDFPKQLYQFSGFHMTVCLSLFSSKQCIIKQLLDSVFVIS